LQKCSNYFPLPFTLMWCSPVTIIHQQWKLKNRNGLKIYIPHIVLTNTLISFYICWYWKSP
jgi:hypothetical protein